MKKINWNEQRDEWTSDMNPSPVWNEGTDAQQEFADNLVENFCKRFAKYLCWAVKDNLIEMEDAENITNCIFYAIDSIEDARWWCNNKNTDDDAIAIKLL